MELDGADLYESFVLPTCPGCGAALLKPSVVFHGGSVPATVTADATARTHACDAVLVVGTTLSTFSAWRLVRDVAQRGGRVGILNDGVTRADNVANVKVETRLGEALAAIAGELVSDRVMGTPAGEEAKRSVTAAQ